MDLLVDIFTTENDRKMLKYPKLLIVRNASDLTYRHDITLYYSCDGVNRL